MNLIASFSQLILIMVLALNALLAFSIYTNNRKSATNVIFVLLSLAISVWLVVISLSATPNSLAITLAYTRLTVFFAVPQSVLFFLLAHTLPSEKLLIKKRWLYLLIIGTVLMMGFTLTPLVFKEVQIQGSIIKSIPGAGIPLFAGFVSFFSLAAIYVLIKKIRKSTGETKQQLSFMMRGILLMLGLIIATIMIPVVIFQNQSFLPLSPLYALIFLGMTAYAIVRFHLFNMKVIATEAFTVLLLGLYLSRIFISTSIQDRIVSIIIFISTGVFGLLLIRSVRSEVKQREQLEILDKQLEDANQKLKVLDVARAEFITIASHQLRTPPATIKWFLAAILAGDYGKFDDSVKESLRKTASTNNSMIALIDDLLNASRIERGKMEFVFVPTNLTEITQITVDQLLPQAEMRKLDLVFVKPKVDLPIISADKEKLRQVINNLIDNAIKYTTEGKIVVELSQTKTDVILKVTDSGRGVAPAELKGIFLKFERGSSAAKNSSGLGLGLYVAKVIIEQHKGKIWVESKGVGKGSTFIFSLPIKSKLSDSEFDLAKGQTVFPPIQKPTA